MLHDARAYGTTRASFSTNKCADFTGKVGIGRRGGAAEGKGEQGGESLRGKKQFRYSSIPKKDIPVRGEGGRRRNGNNH